MARACVGLASLALVAASCTGSVSVGETARPSPGSPNAPPVRPSSPTPTPPSARFDVAAVLADVDRLVALGPREATSDAYERASGLVEDRLERLGYTIRRQQVAVPAGESWGIRVPAGRSSNLIAEPGGFDPSSPYLIVGAHLDTVPQSPGANDNAAGVAMVMELARLAALSGTEVPIVFVAFAAEEPRGPGDDEHHYGSRALVGTLGADGPIGMVSLDRVGIGERVRACTGGLGPRSLADAILERARALGISATICRNRASDHWPFEKAGYPAVRLLGGEHPTYHTARDLPGVLTRAQLVRVGTLAWESIRRMRPNDLR